MDKIRIRDDDILVKSRKYDSFHKFKGLHENICRTDKLLHVPTILTKDILEFPECIEYIRQETWEGRMLPELHGYEHIRYGELPEQEVRNHLEMAVDMLTDMFGRRPTKWYTPWGDNHPHLHRAAEPFKLEVVDCSKVRKLVGRFSPKQLLSEGRDISFLKGREIIMHWWSHNDRTRIDELIEVLLNDS